MVIPYVTFSVKVSIFSIRDATAKQQRKCPVISVLGISIEGYFCSRSHITMNCFNITKGFFKWFEVMYKY